jgi:hypothetical protein
MSELSELLTLANMNNTYWTTFSAVAGAILGYQISGKEFSRRTLTKGLLTLVFVGFAISNVTVIHNTDQARRELLAQVLLERKAQNSALTEHLENAARHEAPPKCVWTVPSIHILLDLVVIAGIWILPKYAVDPKAT